jgi:hypothetical protein
MQYENDNTESLIITFMMLHSSSSVDITRIIEDAITEDSEINESHVDGIVDFERPFKKGVIFLIVWCHI